MWVFYEQHCEENVFIVRMEKPSEDSDQAERCQKAQADQSLYLKQQYPKADSGHMGLIYITKTRLFKYKMYWKFQSQ